MLAKLTRILQISDISLVCKSQRKTDIQESQILSLQKKIRHYFKQLFQGKIGK